MTDPGPGLRPPAATSAIAVEDLTHRYQTAKGPLVVLDAVSLRVPTGEHLAVVGRSGSGKSTLMALVGGLEAPQEGRIEVLGQDLAGLGRDDLAHFRNTEVGFVFQHFGLLDTLTALENVELAATIAGMDRHRRRDRAGELLDLVGLADRADHDPTALSGGERQRVAIARALINEPRLLLADEPTGNLDDESAEVVADLLGALPARTGATVVIVTHDHLLAERADRAVRLRGGRLDPGPSSDRQTGRAETDRAEDDRADADRAAEAALS